MERGGKVEDRNLLKPINLLLPGYAEQREKVAKEFPAL